MRHSNNHMVVCIAFLLSLFFYGCSATGGGPSSTGKGGSMARFAINGNYLYSVSNRYLHVFDISTKSEPKAVNKILLGNGIETIFAYKNVLFFGTRTGMKIFDTRIPQAPQFLSEYQHVYSCDPVVV